MTPKGPMVNESSRGFDADAIAVVEAGPKPLSPEFYDLIYESDSEAENDDYYVRSEDFLELHTKIRKGLIRGLLWWGATLFLVFVGIAYNYV